MRISGSFYDVNNAQVTVTITTAATGNDITIGQDGLFFSGDPVRITQDAEKSTTALIETSCEVGLVSDRYMGDHLYAPNERSISVTVTRGNDTLFSGYVMPMTFSQPFSNPLEPFTVNCIDSIAALQYRTYLDANDSNYDAVKEAASTCRPFSDIILSLFPQGTPIYYDNSKGLDANSLDTMLGDVAVNELIFLGDEADDVVTKEEALESMLRYLDLHVMQRGNTVLIFDWDTLRNGATSWTDLRDGSSVTMTMTSETLTAEMHAAADTNISVGDCYNQVRLKCETEDGNELIVNPLDADSLTSRWSNKQLYMREWIGKTVDWGDYDYPDIITFRNWVIAGMPTQDAGNYKGNDWYLRVMESPHWTFWAYNKDNIDLTLQQMSFEYDADGNPINAYNVPYYLHAARNKPAIFQFGSAEFSPQDNEPVGKVDMSNYLYVSVGTPTANEYATAVENVNPIIEFTGPGGSSLSPVDDETTNYIVFSGSLTLQPPVDKVPYADIKAWMPDGHSRYFTDLPATGSAPQLQCRYYTNQFYNIERPNDPVDKTNYREANLYPPVTGTTQQGKYEYSRDYRNNDLITKLEILECELIIGNKRLIEKDIDADGNSTFQWVTLGQEPTVTEDGVTYPITTFSLGVNPAINDYIIGQERNIQNTVTVAMNLDVEGTAIPIRKSDNVSGGVIFRILGPIYTQWNVVTRRHPTWFRTEQFTSSDEPLLKYVQNVIIKDFKVTVHSDNALNDVIGDKDLIYISERTDDYLNVLDLEDMKIITQPTSEEAAALGVKNAPFVNAAMIASDGSPLREIYKASTQETDKPEKHYVDAYYREFSKPRVDMTTTLHGADVDRLGTYDSTPLGRSFTIKSTEHDVRMDRITCDMREIPQQPQP